MFIPHNTYNSNKTVNNIQLHKNTNNVQTHDNLLKIEVDENKKKLIKQVVKGKLRSIQFTKFFLHAEEICRFKVVLRFPNCQLFVCVVLYNSQY